MPKDKKSVDHKRFVDSFTEKDMPKKRAKTPKASTPPAAKPEVKAPTRVGPTIPRTGSTTTRPGMGRAAGMAGAVMATGAALTGINNYMKSKSGNPKTDASKEADRTARIAAQRAKDKATTEAARKSTKPAATAKPTAPTATTPAKKSTPTAKAPAKAKMSASEKMDWARSQIRKSNPNASEEVMDRMARNLAKTADM